MAGEYLVLADTLPPLRPEGSDEEGALPQLDVIRARVGLEQTDLPVDSACLDGFAFDISKDFYPFGEQPRSFAAFYLACKARFHAPARASTWSSRSRGPIPNTLRQRPSRRACRRSTTAVVVGWRSARTHEYADGTVALTQAETPDETTGVISFVSPMGWDETEINGEKQLWLRLRLVDGDYGQPLAVAVEADPTDNTKFIVNSAPSTLKPPIVARVAVSYVYFTNPMPLEYCVCENDFAFVDRSEDARWPRSPFAPFTPVADRSPALHFGFTGATARRH